MDNFRGKFTKNWIEEGTFLRGCRIKNNFSINSFRSSEGKEGKKGKDSLRRFELCSSEIESWKKRRQRKPRGDLPVGNQRNFGEKWPICNIIPLANWSNQHCKATNEAGSQASRFPRPENLHTLTLQTLYVCIVSFSPKLNRLL